MRLPLLATALLCLASGIAAGAVAQTAAAAPAPANPDTALKALIAADANKDGAWDKAEWLAAGRREMGFNFIDTDRNGRVTREELQIGVAKARAMGMMP